MSNLKLAPSTAAIAPQRVGLFGSASNFAQRASRTRAAAARVAFIVARSPNDNRSDQMNPNNPAYTDSRGGSDGHDDNHADQLNPNNSNYAGSPDDSPDGNDDNRANQLNPNNPNYAGELV